MEIQLVPVYDTKFISNELLICPERGLIFTRGIKVPEEDLDGVHVATLPKRATPQALRELETLLRRREDDIKEFLRSGNKDILENLEIEVYDLMFFLPKFEDALDWMELTKEDLLNAYENWKGFHEDFIDLVVTIARVEGTLLVPEEVDFVLEAWLTES